jgi:hypothetical protein
VAHSTKGNDLDAGIIAGFTEQVLLPRFDEPQPTPRFHYDVWRLCCLPARYVAIAAPRGHAKSTCVTHAYVLAEVLFRCSQFVVIVSDTEGQAADFLNDIRVELTENEVLVELFQVAKMVKEAATDIIVEMIDGYQFRIMAKGSEQKVRGLKWRAKRPDLIVCHARGTEIFDYSLNRWMKVEAHPTAKSWVTDGYEIHLDGEDKPEVVSSQHQYWVKKTPESEPEWVEARNLRPGMLIGDPV